MYNIAVEEYLNIFDAKFHIYISIFYKHIAQNGIRRSRHLFKLQLWVCLDNARRFCNPEIKLL